MHTESVYSGARSEGHSGVRYGSTCAGESVWRKRQGRSQRKKRECGAAATTVRGRREGLSADRTCDCIEKCFAPIDSPAPCSIKRRPRPRHPQPAARPWLRGRPACASSSAAPRAPRSSTTRSDTRNRICTAARTPPACRTTAGRSVQAVLRDVGAPPSFVAFHRFLDPLRCIQQATFPAHLHHRRSRPFCTE